MKIRADEHVAPAIVTAVQEIALSKGVELSSVLNSGYKGSSDVHWITEFMKDSGQAILTADKDFIELVPQVMAVRDTGAKVIHLPKQWAMAEGRLQAAHILVWWRRIETQIREMQPRECYRPPWNIRQDGKLKKIVIDFAKVSRKKKKATRPGRR